MIWHPNIFKEADKFKHMASGVRKNVK